MLRKEAEKATPPITIQDHIDPNYVVELRAIKKLYRIGQLYKLDKQNKQLYAAFASAAI
jgi:hypothetical protein